MVDKCNYCMSKIDRKWNYCPKCGTQTDRRVSMFDILKNQMNVLRNIMTRDEEYESKVQRTNGLTIRINSMGFGQPNVQVFQKPIPVGQEEPYKERRQPERKLTGQIIEPEAKIKRLAKEMIVTLPLPDVKSEKDVELNFLQDSVEVRAFTRNGGYFKILNIPENYKFVEKNLESGNLSLKFAI